MPEGAARSLTESDINFRIPSGTENVQGLVEQQAESTTEKENRNSLVEIFSQDPRVMYRLIAQWDNESGLMKELRKLKPDIKFTKEHKSGESSNSSVIMLEGTELKEKILDAYFEKINSLNKEEYFKFGYPFSEFLSDATMNIKKISRLEACPVATRSIQHLREKKDFYKLPDYDYSDTETNYKIMIARLSKIVVTQTSNETSGEFLKLMEEIGELYPGIGENSTYIVLRFMHNLSKDKTHDYDKEFIDECKNIITSRSSVDYKDFMELDFFNSWIRSTSFTKAVSVVHDNLDMMRKLGINYRGCVKPLAKQFGIRDFARYPYELLVDQYLNMDKDDSPYGVILYPFRDHNGVFYGDVGAFDDLHEQLRGKYRIRVIECEDKIDIAKNLGRLRKKYPEHKISFAIVGGHGSKSSIVFGGNDKKNILEISDFYLPRGKEPSDTHFVKAIKEGRSLPGHYDKRIDKSSFFEPNSNIVLVSCSTGAKRGIAQKLSQALGMKIIGPEISTNFSSFNPEITPQGNLVFHPEYTKGQARSYILGKEDES